MILNAKGGCGKTMIATNLASYYASRGVVTTLMDRDPIAASSHWAHQRDDHLTPIHLITSGKRLSGVTRSWAMRIPQETNRLIIDTPAGVDSQTLEHLLDMADIFLIPVLPSENDIHATSKFISTLFLETRFHQKGKRLGIVANRMRSNTLSAASLNKFLDKLEYPLITSLRDTQNYVHTAAEGMGIFEAKPTSKYLQDIVSWHPLIEWIEPPKVTAQHAPLRLVR